MLWPKIRLDQGKVRFAQRFNIYVIRNTICDPYIKNLKGLITPVYPIVKLLIVCYIITIR